MEQFKKIIEKGRIDLSSTGGLIGLATHILLIAASIYALYKINFSQKTNSPDQPVDFYNVVFIILAIFGVYLLFIFTQKIKVKFYKDDSSIERKKTAVEKVAEANKWKLRKSETNYYFFRENNLLWQSYYITIVFDENGFYLNSYPSRDRIVDFGAAKRNRDEVYEQVKSFL